MTDIEQRLIAAARDGEWLTCAEPDDVVPAGLIRELLLGRHGELDAAGVRLRGARIDGMLNLNRVKASAGLTFTDCTIEEPITALYASLPSLIFNGGRCGGIHADSLHLDSVLFLRNGVRIIADSEPGAVRLVGAHIGGDLDLTGAEITNTAGPALAAGGLEVGGILIFRDGVRILGHGHRGAINLTGAHLASDFDMADTEITNATGPAVVLESAVVDGTFALWRNIRINGHDSGLDLRGAHFLGQFGLRDTEITCSAGIALDANSVKVDGSLMLKSEVRITGRDEASTVNLLGGRISGIVELTDTTITNPAGPAITADRVRIGGDLTLRGRTRLSAGGNGSAIEMAGAHVERFSCDKTVVLETKSAPVLDLRDAAVGVAVGLPHSALCPDRGRGTTCEHKALVRLEHFSYASLASRWDWEEWLHVIRCHTPAYHASGYQRLAAVERAAGHDGTVRRILMAQQTDLRRRSPRSLGGRLTRWFHWLWGVLAGYGYRARRTAAALLLVLVVAGAIGWWAGQVSTRPGHLVAERVASAPVGAGTPCSTVELVGLGLDRGLPLAMTGMRARCDLDTASRKGQAFTAAIWLVQLAVWGLATLALAGYTNLVRKPG
ncbi:hypothetical protein [Lentzea cavernae]|uniref:Membrane-associated oxidoreductase n=1 Tax=Lentzea cavernae TaxID=2020703 RepID=A0ABQ3MK74_9PSEU|nr:hypothetical protein [Lentzea cavernae]GHH45985.1 hypothetical protein GCM10017774_47950 [Lentzea cavernae]